MAYLAYSPWTASPPSALVGVQALLRPGHALADGAVTAAPGLAIADGLGEGFPGRWPGRAAASGTGFVLRSGRERLTQVLSVETEPVRQPARHGTPPRWAALRRLRCRARLAGEHESI